MGLIECNLFLDEQLDDSFANYLFRFSHSYHYKLNNELIKKLYPNAIKDNSYFGDLGQNGEFFATVYTGYKLIRTDEHDDTFPGNIPYVICHWVPINFGNVTVFDKRAYFDRHEECTRNESVDIVLDYMWIKYFIDNFFEPNGYFLSGTVTYDTGKITVNRNIISYELLNAISKVEYLEWINYYLKHLT